MNILKTGINSIMGLFLLAHNASGQSIKTPIDLKFGECASESIRLTDDANFAEGIFERSSEDDLETYRERSTPEGAVMEYSIVTRVLKEEQASSVIKTTFEAVTFDNTNGESTASATAERASATITYDQNSESWSANLNVSGNVEEPTWSDKKVTGMLMVNVACLERDGITIPKNILQF